MTAPKKENQAHIFFDLDGVLADFDLHAEQQGKRTPDGKNIYPALDYDWWVSMPVCPGAKEAYDEARKLGVVKFLTAVPMMSPDGFAGKRAWVEKFAPERGKAVRNDLIICPSADKAYLAHPTHILIDDREQNIREWEAAGGIGIHHTGDFNETMKKLRAAVAKLSPPAKKPVAPRGPKFG